MTTKNKALHSKDAYKIGHKDQYPNGTTEIYSNLTARSGTHSNVPTDGVYFIGLQLFCLDYLIDEWDRTFFHAIKAEVVAAYKRRVSRILGYDVDVSHIEALHDLGYLPVVIKALPEGSFVPYKVPLLTIKNTHPDFFWVTNMLECVLSDELWPAITTATTYMAYKKLFIKFAEMTGAPKEFVPYQGHDFSYRGMFGRHAAAMSGFAVLACGGIGTDCIPAIDIAEDYYGANVDLESVGESVNATEHSVACCGGQDGEIELLNRLLTEVYPEGILSFVSDSWDFWKLVGEYLPQLKSTIQNRNGKLVIRPDSGNPVEIICGSFRPTEDKWEKMGLIESLWNIFGGTVNEKGYKVLSPCIGAIYGDSITYQRAYEILTILEQKGFASCNIVLGIGSFTYQMVTRDTHGMAVKSTNAVINGVSTPIFKDPKTDNGIKKSAKGYLMVSYEHGTFRLKDQVTAREEKHGALKEVFRDGVLVNRVTLMDVISVANTGLY